MASTSSLSFEKEIAIDAVRRACKITEKVFNSSREALTKQDKSPVTIGDFAAQSIVNVLLRKHFPNDSIVGEEDANDLYNQESLRNQVVSLANEGLTSKGKFEISKSLSEQEILDSIDWGNHKGGSKGRFWTLDPIDGTKGFIRGGQYAVCLALIIDGQVKLGVMGCPNLPIDKNVSKPKEGESNELKNRKDLGVLFIAEKDNGAFQTSIIEGNEIDSISMNKLSINNLSNATFCESVEAGHSSQSTNAKIASLLEISKSSVRMDSQAKYASISRGDGDIYLRLPVGDGSYQEKIWDHASGSLLVEEAGGKVTDIRGNSLDFGVGRTLKNNKGIIASQKEIHSNVIKAVRKALEEEGRGHL